MSRQLRTLLIGAVLVVLLGAGSFALKVPYVVLSPGPTVNTLGQDNGTDIIAFKGRAPAKTTGNLNLTTVSVQTDRTTVAGAIRGWLASDEVVVPHDSVYPPGQSEQQTNAQDKQDFIQSQDSATAAAACELKYRRGFGVASVPADSPNAGVLKPGDIFVSLNGVKVTDDGSLRSILSSLKAGQTVPAVLIRSNLQITVTVRMGPPAKGSTTPMLGVTVTTGCLLPFEVTLGLSGIGGPSAGLMFALGIIDKSGADNDLTGGKFIAGTGTIDPDGAVGPIGGIQLKMLGARREGATVFLAPESNCNDVRGNIPAGLTVIKVGTLHEAITSLEAVKAGQTDLPHC
ncbi:MAG: Lon-like protease [Pseudonocardiales bacterium]|jgi:PDZ domain-containing protein|nr:Lon-like protease [Pseudonocardiales bacterium]